MGNKCVSVKESGDQSGNIEKKKPPKVTKKNGKQEETS